jgi:transposase
MLQKGELKMIKEMIEEGMSKSAIARKLGISRETVRRYAKKQEEYIPVIEKEPVETSVDEYLPDISKILESAKKESVHIPTTVIYEEIQALGYEGSLRWLQEMIARYDLRDKAKKEEIVRFETEPGIQMQIDWIEFPKDNLSAFVATLGYSRVSYVEYVTDEKVETLISCHLNAFKYFGGVPHEGLYDNMKTVMIKRNQYGYGKHKLNPLFQDFAKHCGFKIKVHKPYNPQTKGKVERFNHYLRYSFHNALKVKLSMKDYTMNIDNANAEVLKWLNTRANKRIHQTTLQQPFKLLANEQSHLLVMPKPYNGVHPKVIADSIIKNEKSIKSNVPLGVLSIPNRDLSAYDKLIPAFMYIVAMSTLQGGLSWS